MRVENLALKSPSHLIIPFFKTFTYRLDNPCFLRSYMSRYDMEHLTCIPICLFVSLRSVMLFLWIYSLFQNAASSFSLLKDVNMLQLTQDIGIFIRKWDQSSWEQRAAFFRYSCHNIVRVRSRTTRFGSMIVISLQLKVIFTLSYTPLDEQR